MRAPGGIFIPPLPTISTQFSRCTGNATVQACRLNSREFVEYLKLKKINNRKIKSTLFLYEPLICTFFIFIYYFFFTLVLFTINNDSITKTKDKHNFIPDAYIFLILFLTSRFNFLFYYLIMHLKIQHTNFHL